MSRKFLLKPAMLIAATLLLSGPGPAEDPPRAGRFSALTYNVAGLPQGISQSHPLWFQKRISPRLNAFDLVLVQEDFFYHRDLVSKAEHPHISPPGKGGLAGDGLARFSRFPLDPVEHVAWETCHGTWGHSNDCLTKKGFSFGGLELAPGLSIDVYNLHMDAGGSEGDQEARSRQMDQLIAFMEARSAGRAVIMGGDFNLKATRERDLKILDRLLDEQGLADACRTLACPEERIDRILFRGDERLRLTPISYQVELEKFKNPWGGQLSDHEAVSVVFEWELLESRQSKVLPPENQ